MPSGKHSRGIRHEVAVSPPVTGSAPRTRRASPRVLAVAAALLVVAGIAVAGALILGGNSSRSSSWAARGRSDPERGSRRGRRSAALSGHPPARRRARVTGCSCDDGRVRRPSVPVLPRVRDGRPADAAFALRPHREAPHRDADAGIPGPDSVAGRSAALAAGEQRRQFNFSELLYSTREPRTRAGSTRS